MGGFSSFLGKLFGRGRRENVYMNLRDQVFSTVPRAVGIVPDGVWGVVVETGYAEGSATLIALADGTTSMYFSTGGGVIGAGQHERPNAAAKELIRRAAEFVDECQPAKTFPLPQLGETRFYLFLPAGKLTASAPEIELGEDHHRLSPLFFAAHDLITEIRLIQEAKTGSGK